MKLYQNIASFKMQTCPHYIPIYQPIKDHKQIHETVNHITMPSFMIYISPLKSIVPNNTTYSLPQESENVHFFLPCACHHFFVLFSYSFKAPSACPPSRYNIPILKTVISPMPTSPRSHTKVYVAIPPTKSITSASTL